MCKFEFNGLIKFSTIGIVCAQKGKNPLSCSLTGLKDLLVDVRASLTAEPIQSRIHG